MPEPSLHRPGADQPPPEFIVGVSRRDADGTTADVRTAARGVPAIIALVYVSIVLIVVAGFVAAIAMVTRAQHEDPPRRDTGGCTECIERTEHIERIERRCELVDR